MTVFRHVCCRYVDDVNPGIDFLAGCRGADRVQHVLKQPALGGGIPTRAYLALHKNMVACQRRAANKVASLGDVVKNDLCKKSLCAGLLIVYTGDLGGQGAFLRRAQASGLRKKTV